MIKGIKHKLLGPAALASLSVFPVFGQILQLGPFAFDTETRLEAIYTTNVEQERKSEATADRQDWYLVWSLDLSSSAEVFRDTEINLEAGIAIEKHFNRPDLDNSENPFGNIGIEIDRQLGRFNVNLYADYESTSESTEDLFVPIDAGVSRKKRQTGTTFDYGSSLTYESEKIFLEASYEMSQERYDDDQYRLTETDTESIYYEAGLSLATIRGIGIGVSYSVEYTTDTLINVPEEKDEKTENIVFDFDTLELWERPQVTYSIGLEREYTDGESEGWELVQTIEVSDEYDITPRLNLSGNMSYEWEETPEEDDVQFQYGITLTHEISARAEQALTATREPVDTFGSTADTDETEFGYTLNIDDFLLPNLAFDFSATYTISRPVKGDDERVWDYTVGLTHNIPINARLSREFSYEYTREDSNLEDELLEEHRVTLSLILQL